MSNTLAVPVPISGIRFSSTPPVLHVGDHLSVAEFERRYHSMPEVKKAELIDGVVYMSSPVSLDGHGDPHGCLATWLGTYRSFTFGVRMGDNTTVRLNPKSQPQPDLMLIIRPDCGGATTLTDGYVTGAPEHVDEIAGSSVSYDLHSKLREYHKSGVLEYVVWRVYDREIDWFVRNDTDYERIAKDQGVYRSRVFPGLWLDADAMLAGEMQRVLAVLQQGIQSPEHAAFCEQLRQRAAK